MTATGVASPSAQGHATTRTATAGTIDATRAWPVTSQATKVAAAIRRIEGTKIADT